MGPTVSTLNPLEEPGWDERMAAHSSSTVFHTSGWLAALEQAYGFVPCFHLLEAAGSLAGLLGTVDVSSPLTGRRAVAIPFTDLGGAFADRPEDMAALLEKALETARARRWKRVEIRDTGAHPIEGAPSISFYHHVLRLQGGLEEMEQGCSKNTRRNVRKAAQGGLELQRRNDRSAVRIFYDLMCRTRRRHGLPPQPWRFFSGLHEHLIRKDQGFVVLAYREQRPVAGALFLTLGGRAHYKYAASDPRLPMPYAGHAVVHHAIGHLLEAGCTRLCFGRTDLPHEGLRRFKLGWGAEESPLHYYTYDVSRGRYVAHAPSVDTWYNAAVRRCPLPLLRGAGRLLYRHMG